MEICLERKSPMSATNFAVYYKQANLMAKWIKGWMEKYKKTEGVNYKF